MSAGVLLAVLFGALLHASWNALIKSSSDKELDTALVHSLGAVIALPLLAWSGLPPAAALPFMAVSLAINIGYYIALSGAYRHGDLGLTYPLMRGSAPLLVALGSVAWLGESMSPLAWAGVVTVSAGIVLLGLASLRRAWREGGSHGKAVGFALGNAVIIAVYTLVDGLGVRAAVAHGGTAWQYVFGLFLVDGLPFATLTLWRRGAQGRVVALAYCRARWPVASLGSLASLGSYGIALWAMTHAPVAIVAALRESSVLFAAGLGAWLLREDFGWQRAAGTVIIVAGVTAHQLG